MARSVPDDFLPRQPVIGRIRRGRTLADIASLLDLPHLQTHSGRSAILLALHALGVRPGDRVLVPTYHCPTMIAPVECLGALPVFYPIDEAGQPALEWLTAFEWSGVTAILAAHFFGRPIDLEPLSRLCNERGASLIEDCAHAFFSSKASVEIGTKGAFAIGSLPKFFPVAEGGVLASKRNISSVPDLSARHLTDEMRAAWRMIEMAATAGRLGVVGSFVRYVERLRHFIAGRSADLSALPQPTEGEIRSRGLQDRLLLPLRLTRTEAMVIACQDTTASIEARCRNYEAMASGLSGLHGARPLFPHCEPGMAPYVFPLLVDSPDSAYARMRADGIPVFRWDQRWPGTPELPGDVSQIWARSLIQVACHQSLEVHDTDRIVKSIRNSIRGGGV